MGNPDRKSTRLNSSHSQISYAVFCLKKKKNNGDTGPCMSRAPGRLRRRAGSGSVSAAAQAGARPRAGRWRGSLRRTGVSASNVSSRDIIRAHMDLDPDMLRHHDVVHSGLTDDHLHCAFRVRISVALNPFWETQRNIQEKQPSLFFFFNKPPPPEFSPFPLPDPFPI